MLQLTVYTLSSSWVFYRVEYAPPGSLNQFSALTSSPVYSALRSDGRRVNTDFNLWFSLINHKVYLNLIDYIPTPAQTYTYSLSLTRGSLAKPVFTASIYHVNVTEQTLYSDPLFNVHASNDEPTTIMTYSLSNNFGSFSLEPTTGQLRLINVLRYEDASTYSLVVTAVDDGTPAQTGTSLIAVSVIDINDNSPVFGSVPSDVSIEEKMTPDTVIIVISATDEDSGLNGVVELSLSDSSGLFSLNASTNELKVQKPLSGHLGSYNLTVVAHDMGTPMRYSYLNLAIHVIQNNNFAPKFTSESYSFEVNETDDTNIYVGRISATDADGDFRLLSYSLDTIFSLCTTTFPFVIDQSSGLISTIFKIDRGQCATYSFAVIVHDNGSPPTGILSDTSNVTVTIVPVNRYAPQFVGSPYFLHVTENVSGETDILTLAATDKDSGNNGIIAGYALQQNGGNFRLDMVGSFAVLKEILPLQRAIQDHYLLQVCCQFTFNPILIRHLSLFQ
jgi:Cadherin domain